MRQPFQTEMNICLRQCFQLPVKDLENILVGPMTDVPRQRKSVSEWTPEEWDQRWFSGNLKGHSFLIFYQNQNLENIYFSFRMNLRRMRPMMTFGKPHRMLPYNLWKGKFWILLCFNMAFCSSPSPFPWSIFLISCCKHWKYSGFRSKLSFYSNSYKFHADLGLFCQSSIWLNMEREDYGEHV